MNKEILDFAVFLTGHDEETIRQMYNDFVKHNKNQDDLMFDYWLENEPILTKEEHQQKMIELDKACDFVLKNKITPNMDGIY
jgi:hypothetical protein